MAFKRMIFDHSAGQREAEAHVQEAAARARRDAKARAQAEGPKVGTHKAFPPRGFKAPEPVEGVYPRLALQFKRTLALLAK